MWTKVLGLSALQFDRPNIIRFTSVLSIVSAACCLGSSRALAQCTFAGIGDLPGGVFRSQAFDVSSDGTVIVGHSHSEPGWQAFRWTEQEGMIGLGDLPGSIYLSLAWGVSADGSVIVGTGSTSPGSTLEAFRWTPEEGMVGIGFLPGEGIESQAFRVSDPGEVVVGRAWSSAQGEHMAFRWTEQEGMVALGVLDTGVPAQEAWGVSADGSVITGSAWNSPGPLEAFRWTEADGVESLGFLPGGFSSGGCALTPDGLIVYGSGSSGQGPQAWRWTEEEGMVGLGVYFGPTDVSADGSIVVGLVDFVDATLWDERLGFWILQDLLESEYGMDLTGRTLKEAWAFQRTAAPLPGSARIPMDSPKHGSRASREWAVAIMTWMGRSAKRMLPPSRIAFPGRACPLARAASSPTSTMTATWTAMTGCCL